MQKRIEQIEALTPRQLEVLKLLKEGYPQPRIAEMLRIDPKTVRSHAAWILIKLDAPNMVNAVYKAALAGLI